MAKLSYILKCDCSRVVVVGTPSSRAFSKEKTNTYRRNTNCFNCKSSVMAYIQA